MSTLRLFAACVFLVLYLVVLGLAYNGFWETWAKFRYRRPGARRKDLAAGGSTGVVEGVSIIRPLKGVDPQMRSCLEASFVQDYPLDKFEILFCVDDVADAAVPIVESLIAQYPLVNARILVPREHEGHYGPNPKVNNMAKGFVEAQYDIVWAMDSNVWAASRVLARSVRSLQGSIDNGRVVRGSRKVKLVHHTPLAIVADDDEGAPDYYKASGADTTATACASRAASGRNSPDGHPYTQLHSSAPLVRSHARASRAVRRGAAARRFGAQLDEMFLLTSHSKFYISFNNVAIAPCVNGKSNMYRRSDLDHAVAQIPRVGAASPFFGSPDVMRDAQYYSSLGRGHSIKFFSRYIGEDNMIGICLWENAAGRTGMTGDVVVQPLSGEDNGVRDYMMRRMRWLRVRKYMVLAATLLEPTAESLVAGVYGNFALVSLFTDGRRWFNWWLFAAHMAAWMATDWVQYHVLLDNAVHCDLRLPVWLQEDNVAALQRAPWRWAVAWLGREVLALPIWVLAMAGHEIDWRGRPFKIKHDLTAEEL
ncbi:Ceramide glucosyltransferase [[Candida] zeylanoides]